MFSEGRQQQECAKYANVPALLAPTLPQQLIAVLASSPSHCPQHPQALCMLSHLRPTSIAMHHRLIFFKKSCSRGIVHLKT